MTPEDAEEYTQSLGQIVAGSWRQIAWAHTQGIPEALDLTTREWVAKRLGGYVRLTAPDRTFAILELIQQGMRYTDIRDVLGVGKQTITETKRSEGLIPPPEPPDQDESTESGLPEAPDQDESTESGLPEAPPVIDPEEQLREQREQALRDSHEAFGRAIHTLANYHDAPDARRELVRTYKPPGLKVKVRDIEQARKALEGFVDEWG